FRRTVAAQPAGASDTDCLKSWRRSASLFAPIPIGLFNYCLTDKGLFGRRVWGSVSTDGIQKLLDCAFYPDERAFCNGRWLWEERSFVRIRFRLDVNPSPGPNFQGA